MNTFISFLVTVATATVACASAANALADTVQRGTTAPASVVKQISANAAVTIGSVSVRPIPRSIEGVRSTTPPGTTLVARATDNLVGTSTNDLVVIYGDVDAITGRAATMGGGVSTRAYPTMGMTVVHVASFDQLQSVQRQIAQAFPTATFDLPVRYFDTKPR